MPDIAKCYGQDCPYKYQCYRYTSEPSELQAYFIDAPIKDGRCDYYWGENAEQIWNKLNDIVSISKTDKPLKV